MLSMSAIRSKLRMTSLPSERSCSSSVWSGTRIRLRAAEAKSKHPAVAWENGGRWAACANQWRAVAQFGRLHVNCTGHGEESRQASCVQQRTTSPAHDLRAFPSGPNKPQIPVFSRETWQRDLARLENREIVGVLENAV